jgi:DNA-binding GntR family transcriptional regulator
VGAMDSYSVEKPVPFYDQLYHKIKKMIFDGFFKPGERIVESKLARDMNVSRSPVREAIRALEKEGLVVIDEKSRIIVYMPTVQDMEDVYQCRMALESLAVRLFIQRAADDEVNLIEETLRLTQTKIEHCEGYDKDEVISLNARYHDLIIQFSRNIRLQKQLSDLKSLSYLYRVLNFRGENRANIILNEHREIFDAIKQRNEQKASDSMIAHLNHDYNHLLELLDAPHDKNE